MAFIAFAMFRFIPCLDFDVFDGAIFDLSGSTCIESSRKVL